MGSCGIYIGKNKYQLKSRISNLSAFERVVCTKFDIYVLMATWSANGLKLGSPQTLQDIIKKSFKIPKG